MSCNKKICPWKQDAENANHYVCLDCGRHRWIGEFPGEFLLLVAVALILTYLIHGRNLQGIQGKPVIVENPSNPSLTRKN